MLRARGHGVAEIKRLRDMRTSSAFRGWVRVLGYGFEVRGKSDLVRADCEASWRVAGRSKFRAARTCAQSSIVFVLVH